MLEEVLHRRMSAVPQGQAADSPMLHLVNIMSESTVACPQSDHDQLVRPGELVETVFRDVVWMLVSSSSRLLLSDYGLHFTRCDLLVVLWPLAQFFGQSTSFLIATDVAMGWYPLGRQSSSGLLHYCVTSLQS